MKKSLKALMLRSNKRLNKALKVATPVQNNLPLPIPRAIRA